MLRTRLLTAAATLLASVPSQAQTSIATNSPGGQPLSTRVVAYTIDARLNTDKKSLDATETFTYKNLTGQALTTVPFHLYLNAFRPESTFTRETHFNGGVRDSESDNDYPAEKLGSITISHIDADGYGDLTSAMHFIAPDDGNAQDHTVAEITLTHPLAPNDSITFHLAFHDQFPLSVARNGYKRDFIMGGQWYPKPGVFWHGAWNCHQYHATTEFFSDFATFNVTLTLPRRYVVGASGVPTGEFVNPVVPGQEAPRPSASTAKTSATSPSPPALNFTVTDGTFLSSLGPVKVHVLALAAHPKAGPRYLDITQKALAEFDRRYGPYPYKIITVIDPEPGSEIGGMEYPTLFTGDTSWYRTQPTSPPNSQSCMNSATSTGTAWSPPTSSRTPGSTKASTPTPKSKPSTQSSAAIPLSSIVPTPTPATPNSSASNTWSYPTTIPSPAGPSSFATRDSYGGITYGKSATLLATLEGLIGRDTMDEAMRTYFLRYRFTHPTTEDFLRTIEQVAIAHGKAIATIPQTPPKLTQTSNLPMGAEPPKISILPTSPPFTATGNPDYASAPATNSSLRDYFNQSVYGTQILDYTVDSISSDPAQWWLPEPRDKKQIQYLSTVYLHRKGDFILPVTAEIVFDDGTRIRERWNGVDRWTKFTYTRKAQIISAEIDPDHVIPLDSNLFNNSYTIDSNPVPARKLTNLWLALNQFAAQLVAWIV